MPIITIASQKGGSGKTTIATNIAEALNAEGELVLLIDADPQRSALAWAGFTPPGVTGPTVIAADAQTLTKKHLERLAAPFNWVIIDTPPRLSAATIAAIAAADLLLVPVRPSPLDIATLPVILAHLEQIPGKKTRAVITQRAARSTVADSAADAVREAGISPMTASLGFRADYVDATSLGRGVVATAPKSKAADEIHALIEEIRMVFNPRRSIRREA